MPNKDLVRSERVSVRQRVVDLLAWRRRGARSFISLRQADCTSRDPLLKNAVSKDEL
jgi:hypothetical protein